MYNLFNTKNGLRVVAEKIDYVNSISVGLWIENGSRNEDPINNGISHFIEHMLFKGTENRTAKEIVECIEEVGGQINAFTGKEATCFYIKALNTYLELSLDLLSDMLFNSKFDNEDIEKEKNVIIEEINMGEDSPEDVLSDLHFEAIYGEDSLALPILGSIKTVKSFTRNQIVEYLKSHYIPENSVISICGNFDMNELEKLIEKYFGNWSCSNKIVTEYKSPLILNSHVYKKKKIEQMHVNLGIIGIETGNDDVYPLHILNSILGGGASSILFQKIREELGLCYSVYSYLSSFKKTGIITIYAGLNLGSAYEALIAIKEEINKFAMEDITDDKLYKAKEQLKGGYILGLESTSSRMFNNGKSLLFLNKLLSPEDTLKKIDDVNKERVYNVMEQTFKKGIQNSAYVGDNLNIDSLKTVVEGDIIAFKNKKSKRV